MSVFKRFLPLATVALALFLTPSAFAAETRPDMPAHKGPHMMGMMKGDYSDRAYLSAMIAHHEAAVEMSRAVLEKGSNSKVRDWAGEIISDQQEEIEKMRSWLNGVGGVDAEPDRMMRESMRHMQDNPMSDNADVNYVRMMIHHHAGAIHMATQALVNSNDKRIIDLSQDIIESQSEEIVDFKEWLARD